MNSRQSAVQSLFITIRIQSRRFVSLAINHQIFPLRLTFDFVNKLNAHAFKTIAKICIFGWKRITQPVFSFCTCFSIMEMVLPFTSSFFSKILFFLIIFCFVFSTVFLLASIIQLLQIEKKVNNKIVLTFVQRSQIMESWKSKFLHSFMHLHLSFLFFFSKVIFSFEK